MLPILLLVLDLGGTFVFALSGAMAAVKHRLDIFGVLVLSFAAGNAGGITRDLLIGAVPPAAISDWRYAGVSALAGLITFFWYPVDQTGCAARCCGSTPWDWRSSRSPARRRRCLRAQPGDGGLARHADRDRRRHAARCAGLPRFPPCCAPICMPSRRLPAPAVVVIGTVLHAPADRGHDCRRGPLLRAALHGDPPRLAPADRAAGRGRSRRRATTPTPRRGALRWERAYCCAAACSMAWPTA